MDYEVMGFFFFWSDSLVYIKTKDFWVYISP